MEEGINVFTVITYFAYSGGKGERSEVECPLQMRGGGGGGGVGPSF